MPASRGFAFLVAHTNSSASTISSACTACCCLQAEAEASLGFVATPAWLQFVDVPVAQLLVSLGLDQYVQLLEQQQVDMAALQLLEKQDLLEMGLPIGAVVKIRAAVAAMGVAP
jgi:hypothetical protein